MAEVWEYVLKVLIALLAGLVFVILLVPERRAEAFSFVQSISAVFAQEDAVLTASALTATESIQDKQPLFTPFPEDQMLISSKSNYAIEGNCAVDFNAQAPGLSINYFSEELERELVIPFSKAWGNSFFSINPYEKKSSSYESVSFGPIVKNMHCKWVRPLTLTIGPIEMVNPPEDILTQKIIGEKRVIVSQKQNIEMSFSSQYYQSIFDSL